MTARAPGRFAKAWSTVGAAGRRRIVLGSLVVVSLAVRDALLFFTATGLFGLSELAPAPSKAPARVAS